MVSNSSWVPDEDSQTLFSERCWLQGVVITAITYGIAVSLYSLSFYHLIRDKNRVEFKKRLPLLIYITVAFLLVTVYMVNMAGYAQMAFIDDRNYPGGPNAFENNVVSAPVGGTAIVAYVVSNWVSDTLVVWRFKVVYQMCQVPTWVLMFFPCLLLTGSVVMGMIFLIQCLTTTTSYLTVMTNYGLPCLSLSLALNIILTIAIVIRLLTFRHHIVSLMGPKYGTRYVSVSAMIIESAALYSAICVIFIVLYGIGNVVFNVFFQSLIQFQTIATLLIVFRVAQGKGWTQDTAIHAMSGIDPPGLKDIQLTSSPGASGMLEDSKEVIQCSGGEENLSATDRCQRTSQCIEERNIE